MSAPRFWAPEAPQNVDDPSVIRVLQEYRQAIEAGTKPNRKEMLALHPRIAGELAACFDALDFVHEVAPRLYEAGDRSQTSALSPAEMFKASPLGDFRIRREIGRGGMGVVYEAEQISLGRRVALKVLPFAAALDAKQLQRFKNEAQAAAQLHHQNIVPVYAVSMERGVHYYAMQYIEGQTVAAMMGDLQRASGRPQSSLQTTQDAPAPGLEAASAFAPARFLTPAPAAASAPAPPTPSAPALPTPPVGAGSTERSPRSPEYFRTVAQLGVQAAEGLEHAHQLGVIHRDIKPANLLVDIRGNLWITDFGLAQFHGDKQLTMTGDLVGTLRYMSPEQSLAKRVPVDHRTDIYSLGVTLYEMLTLQPAFSGNDRLELLRQIAFEEPKAPRTINKSIPNELETIVIKAIAKNSAERYGTAQELADDLQRFLDDKPIWARRPTVLQKMRKWGRRHKTAVWSATLCLLTVGLVAAASIGWIARDRAARYAKINDEVGKAVQEGSMHEERALTLIDNPYQWETTLAAGLSALKRAEALLAGDEEMLDPALRARVQALAARLQGDKKDRDMVATVERIRLEQSQPNVKENRFSNREAVPKYREAFGAYGLVAGKTPPKDVAAVLGGTHPAIQTALVAAIDDWLMMGLVSDQATDQERQWLSAVLAAADPNVWPNRVRAATLKGDRQALEALAQRPEATQQPPATLVILANALRTKGTDQSAVHLLRRAQESHPGDFWISHLLADQLMRAKPPQLEEAITFYRVALALRPRNAGVWVNLGNTLKAKGELAGAVAAHRRAIDLAPEYAAAHNNLGAALMAQKDLPGAIAAYRRAIDLDPKAATPHNNLGAALKAQKDLPGAIAAFEKAIALDPKYASPYSNLGNVRMAQNDLPAAVAAYQQAIDLDPESAEAHYSLGNALVAQKDLPGAIAAYRKATDLDPKLAKAHNNLGNALKTQNDLPAAVVAYRQAIELDPKLVEPYNNLAIVLKLQNDLPGAIAAYRKAIELAPKSAPIHFNLGNALRAQNDLPGAIAAYRKAIDLDPRMAAAHTNLAHMRSQDGAYAEAATHFTQAKELQPKNALLWSYEALAHLGAGNLEAYRQVCADMLQRFEKTRNPALISRMLSACLATPDAVADPAALIALGERAVPAPGGYAGIRAATLYRAGKYDAAVHDFNEAAKAAPLRAADWYLLAMAHHRLGRADQARQAIDKGARWIETANRQETEGKKAWLGWFERIAADCLRREAEALVLPTSPAKAASKN